MEHEKIERINELARLSRQRPLTGDEAAEREALRKAYIAEFRANTQRTLERVRVRETDGTLRPLRRKDDRPGK